LVSEMLSQCKQFLKAATKEVASIVDTLHIGQQTLHVLEAY